MLRQMLRGPGPGAEGQGSDPQLGMRGQDPEDPMLRMMQQVMGTMGGQGGPTSDALPPGFAEMFGAVSQQEPTINDKDYLWRIFHIISSLSLAFYAVSSFHITGSKFARETIVEGNTGQQLFWIFTTLELVLQSSRYFIDGGRPPPSGILATAGQLLPPPWGDYLRILSRYRIIYTTVVSDALLIIFVLGCAAWWNGLGTS